MQQRCQRAGRPNHFDLLSIPENHLELAQKMKGQGFGLLADFGNYPENIDRYEAFKMIAPYTFLFAYEREMRSCK